MFVTKDLLNARCDHIPPEDVGGIELVEQKRVACCHGNSSMQTIIAQFPLREGSSIMHFVQALGHGGYVAWPCPRGSQSRELGFENEPSFYDIVGSDRCADVCGPLAIRAARANKGTPPDVTPDHTLVLKAFQSRPQPAARKAKRFGKSWLCGKPILSGFDGSVYELSQNGYIL